MSSKKSRWTTKQNEQSHLVLSRDFQKLALHAPFRSTFDSAENDFPFEWPEDNHAEFHCRGSEERRAEAANEALELPLTLTMPVPCPIKPSEEVRMSKTQTQRPIFWITWACQLMTLQAHLGNLQHKAYLPDSSTSCSDYLLSLRYYVSEIVRA